MSDKFDIESPDALEAAGAKKGIRVGKKAAAIGVAVLSAAGLLIAVNVATRKPAQLSKNGGAPGDQTVNIKLQPATQAATEITRAADNPASAGSTGNPWAKSSQPEGMPASAAQAPDGGMQANISSGTPWLKPAAAPAAGQATMRTVPDLGAAPGSAATAPTTSAPPLGGNGNPPVLSEQEQAAKRLREEREQDRQRALKAGSRLPTYAAGAPSVQPQSAAEGYQAAIAAQLKGLQPTAIPAAASVGGNPNEEPDQNRQAQKQAFLDRASALTPTPYLGAVRKKPLSELELKTGTVIPAIMIDGINSDLPGDVCAQVSQNVYDTATGRYLLIPQGAKVCGTYDSSVAYGQDGLLMIWKRLIFPDASTLELGGMAGADSSGYAGFRDQVNNHYGRMVGFGLATSLFSAAFQLSQPQQTTNGQLNSQQTVAAAVGQQMSQLGVEVTRKNLRIQPTIEIRPGYRFIVKINRDVIFPSVYK